MIPDDNVERVRESADIVSIIGEYVQLKRSGNSFRGPCPFHQGTHNNFSVTPRGGYACFVCGEKGDVFTFVQKYLGLDFVGAVKLVAEKSGVEVREVKGARAEERDPREPFWEINNAAAEFFQAQLREAPEGKVARDYLDSRDISPENAARFGIGFSPRGDDLRRHLAALGYDDRRQAQAGLLIIPEDRAEPRVRFRNRLMFPIWDAPGHLVGFGGRVMGKGEPKYLNSPESEIFTKRALLYGLNWAKNAIRKADRVFVVEGYFDVIRLMLAGVEEAVAPMGTAMTEAQGALVKKYTRNAFLLYDSDSAGLKATFRSGDVLLATGVSARVVSLPEGEDPDTFTARHGAAGLEKAISQSIDVFDRKIQILERAGYFADLRHKREALDKLLPTIRVTEDRLLKDLYITRTAEVAGVSREMLERELAEAPKTRPVAAAAPVARQSDPQPVRRGERRLNRVAKGVRAERELVRMLLHQRQFVEWTAERIDSDSFLDPTYQRIYAELITRGPDVSIEDLAGAVDTETAEVLQGLLLEPGGLDRAEETVTGSVNSIQAREADRRLSEIDRLLPAADADEKDRLIQEKRRLMSDIQALGSPRWKGFNSPRSNALREDS
ncbi:MAG TPA: DNA primase [Gemmatimonadaceae bacterium]|nr:DNA primase [Gemmatimonadaceae bacterium]